MRLYVLLLAALLLGCARARPNLTPDALVDVRTDDGWTLTLRRYEAEGPPVLLMHGLSANHQNFDFHRSVSLAAWLQARGWDVWVPNLRGDPGSVGPSRRARRNFSFDDLVRQDVPAILDGIEEQTGRKPLWVGHSLGGAMLYATLTLQPDAVPAGVTIGSPASFHHPDHLMTSAGRLRWAVRGRGLVPTRGLSRAAAALGLLRLLEARVAARGQLSPAMLRGMAWHTIWPFPRPLAHQLLTWIRVGEITSHDGEPWVRSMTTPLLVMGGPSDRIVPYADIRAACDYARECTWVSLSVDGGLSHDYGHVDSLLGRTAPAEVYWRVHDFLASQVPDAPPSVPAMEPQ